MRGAIVDHHDHHCRVALLSFDFRRCRDLFRCCERKDFFLGELGAGAVLPLESLSVLVVDTERGAVLVPFVAQICPEIDVQHRRIVIDPPEGLLDLNRAG